MNEDARFSLRPLPQPGGGKNIPKAHVLQVFVKEKKQKQGSKRTLPFGQKKKIEDEHVQRKYVNFTSYPTSRPTQIGEYTPMYMDQMPPLVGKPLKMAGFLAQKFGVPRLLFKLGGRDALCNVRELDKWSERWDPRVILPSIPQRPCALTDIMASPESPYVTAMDLQKLYISGKITPSQVISNVLEIITTNPTVQQTFVTIDFLTVLKAAAASTLRYQKGQPLSIFDGIPVGVKDEVNVKGLPTTFCCKLADFDQNELRSAWAIEKLEEMGSIIIGKTTMHEMGIDNLCINPVNGVCRNPWDPSRLSGGSSGGSAFAAAAGLCPITIGADGGGSIRVPASWCGMYGLKASFGRISNDPRPSFGPDWSANVIGPMAATMQDLEMTYLVMAKQNPLDALGEAMPAPSVYCKEKPVLGVYWPWFNDCSPQVLQTCEATLEYFKSAFNAEIVDIEVPYIHEGRSASLLTLLAEMAATFRKFPDTHKLSPATQIMYSIGQIVSVEDIQASARLRNLLMCHFSHLFRMYAGISRPLVIVTPTTPITAPPVYASTEHGVADINMSVQSMEYAWLSAFIGCPSLTFPVGYDNLGMPIGMLAMTEWGCENVCFKVGRWGEKFLHDKGKRLPSMWWDITSQKTPSASM